MGVVRCGVMPRSQARQKDASRHRGDSLESIHHDVETCERCPRLRRYCKSVARTRKRAFRDETYWGKPVPGFGDPAARLCIVGLAPAAHGANRTGRMFTGDSSGDWLYEALHRFGFAAQPHSTSRHDGQVLRDVYIGAAARCAPPDNKPTQDEIARCSVYLEREFAVLQRIRLVLPLGRIGYDATLQLLAAAGYDIPRPKPRFSHAAEYVLTSSHSGRPPITLLLSFHPSRQNTQTGRLKREMWHAVFARARQILEADSNTLQGPEVTEHRRQM